MRAFLAHLSNAQSSPFQHVQISITGGNHMIRGIHHFALQTKNFEAMRKFYKEAFGFEEVGHEMRWADSEIGDKVVGLEGTAARGISLKAANCYFEMYEYLSPPARNAEPARPCDIGYTHFCFEVTDIEGEFERLKALGMRFTIEAPADFGHLKTCYGRDPDGNYIELQQVADGADTDFARLALVPSGKVGR
jgi:catechol 2,3-dioxygenase-like lactoylglutathione lyase family enzyme